MEIRVKANGGLGNKMRVLASCVALQQTLHEEVTVVWENTKALNCSYHKLFLPIDGIKIEEKGFLNWYQRLGISKRKAELNAYVKEHDIYVGDSEIRQLKHLKSDFLKVIKDFYSVYVNTCESFYGDSSYLAYLLPIEKVKKEVNRRRDLLGGAYLGVHIRRGDNEEATAISTTNKFNKHIGDELDANPNARFYLSTDSEEEAKRMKRNFGDAIIHVPVGLNRAKDSDIQMALVDLLMLSGAQKIIGSHWSSFSEVAAGYGSVPLTQVGAE